jgi:hypothetical protein
LRAQPVRFEHLIGAGFGLEQRSEDEHILARPAGAGPGRFACLLLEGEPPLRSQNGVWALANRTDATLDPLVA